MGSLQRVAGRDIHNRETFMPATQCPFGPVNLIIKDLKTTVRADSSASRGAADETTSTAKILVPAAVTINRGDKFSFQGQDYRVTTIHNRFSVFGEFDHQECDMQAWVAVA